MIQISVCQGKCHSPNVKVHRHKCRRLKQEILLCDKCFSSCRGADTYYATNGKYQKQYNTVNKEKLREYYRATTSARRKEESYQRRIKTFSEILKPCGLTDKHIKDIAKKWSIRAL